MKFFSIKNALAILVLNILAVAPVFAEPQCASANFSVTVPEYFRIQTVTSPVLIANITDRTGNLYTPLQSCFRVISNLEHAKKLYLSANTPTTAGMEPAMFERGGRVYVAFANLEKVPESQSLANCKIGADPKASPGIVAYPVASVIGGRPKYLRGRGKYELYAPNGITDITVNIDTSVLRSSFAENDPNGFYQTTLELTEADI